MACKFQGAFREIKEKEHGVRIQRGIPRNKEKERLSSFNGILLIRLFLSSLANPYNTHVKPFVSPCFAR